MSASLFLFKDFKLECVFFFLFVCFCIVFVIMLSMEAFSFKVQRGIPFHNADAVWPLLFSEVLGKTSSCC